MVGKRLAGEKFDRVFVSDLKRTVDTAQIITDCIESDEKPQVVLDERLREKSAGIYEGCPLGSTSE